MKNFLFLIIGLFFSLTSRTEVSFKNIDGTNSQVTITTDKEYVIIKSDEYKGANVHVLFGGHSTNPSYSRHGASLGAMKRYIPHLQPYSKNAIIVITHHMNTLDNVKKYVKDKFGGTVTSIAGGTASIQGGQYTGTDAFRVLSSGVDTDYSWTASAEL